MPDLLDLSEYNGHMPVEELSEYEDGGLYPIIINDWFQDGRYQIVNKLGFGGYSTVWVARDHQKNIDVALKVIKAKYSENNTELRILQLIANDTTQHPGHKYLPRLLDSFYHGGPGRRCLFLVLELLGPSVRTIIKYYPNYVLSLSRSRQFSRQLLLAIDYLHSHGIVHGDIHESNILLRLPDNFKLHLDEEDIEQSEITRKDGAPLEKGKPRFQVEPIAMDYHVDPKSTKEERKKKLLKLNHIQLIDFSSSFFESEIPESIHDTLHPLIHISPPEYIFHMPLTKSIDIWYLALMTFWFATSSELFWTTGDFRSIIPQIHRTLGESSAHFLLTGLSEAVYSGVWEKRKPLYFNHFRDYETIESMMPQSYDPEGNGLSDAEKEHLRILSRYLRRFMIADPSKRATTKELQDDEFVQVDEKGEDDEEDDDEDDNEGEVEVKVEEEEEVNKIK